MEIQHQQLCINGVNYHLANCGSGPLVLFTHGFPECWYSWRHQLPAVAKAGFHAVAVDMPGYGQSDKPQAVERYNQIALSDDMVAIAEQLGHEQFVSVGHDWGAPTAWHTALRFPDRVRAVAGLSIPYGGRPPQPPTQGFRRLFGERFFYMLYFQQAGLAERELEGDIARFLRSFWWSGCADASVGFVDIDQPSTAGLLEALPDPGILPAFLTPEEAQYYVRQFEQHGLRGPLNYYRNLDRNWALSEPYADARIEQPALFLYGDSDPATQLGGELRRMPRHVTQLQTVEIANCGHWIQQEHPALVNRHLIDFLQNI